MSGDDWKPTIPERPSSRDSKGRGEASEGAPPATSSRYVGGAEIARGGMGRVIEATDTLLARTVAVKEALTSDPETLRRFARETRITARLEHPSIVPVYDAGTDPAAPFYVMRRVTGRPLSGMITAANSLDERLALVPHVLACAQAIAHAHKRGVLHRDIKPNNILVGELGETVVIDWGIAKVIGETDPDDDLPPLASDSLRTRIGTVSGTPGFMSPEQARGDDVGPSADVWALGATLYYLLARQMPHETHAKTPDDLLAYAAHRPVPPIASVIAGVPPELAAITERALAFEVSDRFPDAISFAEELSRFLTGQIVASHDYSVRERIVRWVKRHRAIVAVAALAITAVAVVSTLAIRRVVAARERADASAQQAEIARAKEHAHAEAELLARARAIATTNPTAAIAAIDQLPPTSPRAGDADAIFATAVSHGGAAWGLAGNSGANAILELDPTGARLMQLSHAGQLQIWDLDRRALIAERTIDQLIEYPMWIARGVLLYGSAGTRLFDPTTKQTTPLGTSLLKDAVASADGTRIGVIGADDSAGWLDPRTGAVAVISGTDKVLSMVMPRDGSWLAARTAGAVIVFDPAGTVILRRPAAATWMSASSSRHLAFLDGKQLFEIELSTGVIHERSNPGIVWPEYRGETLVGRTPGAIYVYSELDVAKPPIQIARISGVSTGMTEAGSGMLAFTGASSSNELLYFDRVHVIQIPLPEALVFPRIASRPGQTRVVVSSNSSLIVLDLRYLLPRERSDITANIAQFVSDEHVMGRSDRGLWTLYALGKQATLESIEPYAEVTEVSPGRVLFANRPFDADSIYVFDIARMRIFHAKASRARLVDGGAIYISDDKLYLFRDEETEGREIATLKSKNDALLVSDGSTFRVFAGGEILRGDVAQGVTERAPFVLPKTGALISIRGRLLVGDGKQLHWDSTTGPLVGTVEDTIDSMYWSGGGALIVLASRRTVYAAIAADGSVTLHHLSSATLTSTGKAGRALVPSASGTEVIDLPSRRRWVHPIVNPIPMALSLTPDGTRLLELGADRTWWEWTLPSTNLAGDGMRHTATNAREQDDRVLLWPWQTTR